MANLKIISFKYIWRSTPPYYTLHNQLCHFSQLHLHQIIHNFFNIIRGVSLLKKIGGGEDLNPQPSSSRWHAKPSERPTFHAFITQHLKYIKAHDFYTENGKTSRPRLEPQTPSCPRAQHNHLGMLISVYTLASNYILHIKWRGFLKTTWNLS